MCRNIVYTNGYSISFLFSRLTKRDKTGESRKKQPADYLQDIEDGCDIWGVNPGINSIITAVDTSGRQRKTSLDEYYHLCGYNNANSLRKKYQKQRMAQFLKISNLSSLKTSDIADYTKACQERLSLYHDIANYYNENDW